MRDPYEVLNVKRDASDAEIKTSYRKLAKKLHPDVNHGDVKVEQRFKEISQAYSILGDTEKRKRFNRGEIDAGGQETPFGKGFQGGGFRGGGFRGGRPGGGGEGGFRPEDIFNEFFGGGRRRGYPGGQPGGHPGQAGGRPNRGADLKTRLQVTFEEAARGATKRLRMKEGRMLDLQVKPGAESGQVLRLKGQGNPPPVKGGQAGDVLVEIEVQPHRFFTRKGQNIYLDLPVTLQEALLGAEIEVPTLDGRVSMKIPAGSNSGNTLRLKSKGIQDPKTGQAGDQYVKLKLVLPDKPDRKLEAFVKSWGKGRKDNPRQSLDSNGET